MKKSFPSDKKELGYFIGIDEQCVNVMSFKIITSTGKVVIRKEVWALTDDVEKDILVQECLTDLRKALTEKIGDALKDKEINPKLGSEEPLPEDELFDNEHDPATEPFKKDAFRLEANDFTPEGYDNYLSAKVLLPRAGKEFHATVKARKRDANGNPIGKRNENPLLDTREYEVKFSDRMTGSYLANQIAENLYAQVDDHGRSYSIIQEIVSHRKDGHALAADDGWFTAPNGKKSCRQMTKAGSSYANAKGASRAGSCSKI